MARVEGLQKLVAQLRARAAKSIKDDDVSVSVGYTAKYALFVHENLNPVNLGKSIPRASGLGVYWGPSNYGPHFLSGPAREFQKDIAEIVKTALKQRKTMAQALLLGGLRLQRESQIRVPVEYGVLRASAFTRLDQPVH